MRPRNQAVLVVALALTLAALAASLAGSAAYSGGTTSPSASPVAVNDVWEGGVAIVPQPLLVIALALALILAVVSTARPGRAAASGADLARAPPFA